MATKANQKYFKWLSTLSTEEAWNRIIEDAAVGMTVDPQKFLKSVSPLPDFKDPAAVRRWLDFVLTKIDVDITVEEAKVLHICCDTLAAFFQLPTSLSDR
jgi:hypothetical protein